MTEISLNLKNELALTFNYFRSQVSNDRKKKATNIDVMVALFQAMKVKRVMESKIQSLQSKIATLNDDIMGLLRDSINRPINIQVGALAQATAIPVAPPIPNLPPLTRQAEPMIKEMNKRFLEGKLKPSEIMTAEFDEPILLEVDEE